MNFNEHVTMHESEGEGDLELDNTKDNKNINDIVILEKNEILESWLNLRQETKKEENHLLTTLTGIALCRYF